MAKKKKDVEMVVTNEIVGPLIEKDFFPDEPDAGYVASLNEDAGVAEKTKEPDIELVDELCRYEFTDAELVDLATEIGELMHKVDRITAEKKSAASAFDSDLKKADLDMQTMAQLIRDRFEMRRMQCYCVKDFKGRKAYYFRADQRELEFESDTDPGADADFVGHESLLGELGEGGE